MGWVCHPVTNSCVEGGLGRCSEDGALELSNLRTEWVTPNQARLTWEAEGLESLFEYEIEIAASDEALADGDLIRIVGHDDNPELARNRLLNAADGDPVVATTLTGLEADTAYRVRLVAEDTAGGFSCSPSIGVRTDPEATRQVALTDELEAGARPRPACVTYEDDPAGAASGDHYWQWIARCEETADGAVATCAEPVDPAPACWENIRIEGLNYELDLSPGRFQGGFLELWVDISGSEHGYWGQIGLSTGSEDGVGQQFFSRGRLTLISGGGYHRYQLPLRSLNGGGRPLAAEDLDRGLRSFRVGTEWDAGAVVRIDDVAIRW